MGTQVPHIFTYFSSVNSTQIRVIYLIHYFIQNLQSLNNPKSFSLFKQGDVYMYMHIYIYLASTN